MPMTIPAASAAVASETTSPLPVSVEVADGPVVVRTSMRRPHITQNFAFAGTSAPHRGHVVMSSA